MDGWRVKTDHMDVVTALKIINCCCFNSCCYKPLFHSLLTLSAPQTAFLEVVIPPDIVNEETSGDMMVPEGGSAKFICKAGGYPKPKIVWRREDSREIIARETTKGRTKGEHNGWLRADRAIPLTPLIDSCLEITLCLFPFIVCSPHGRR